VPIAARGSSAPRVPPASARSAGWTRSLALRAAGVLVVSVAAAAGLSSALSAGTGTPVVRPRAALPEVRTVPAAEAAAFAILRQPLHASDAFAQIHPGAGPDGANPNLARTLREPAGGLSAGTVSVVPADGWVCLRVPFVGIRAAQWWCQTLAQARAGRLLMALRPAGPLRASDQLLIGLVPDGVRSVTITAAGGVRRVVAVRENVYDTQIYTPRTIAIDLPRRGTLSYRAP
jgi:hypothetical protein